MSQLFTHQYENHSPSRPIAVYFQPGVWQEQNAEHRLTNQERYRIIMKLRSVLGETFLGGFINNPTSMALYPEATFLHSTTHEEYVSNIQRSQIVISTNGVDGCHSWRTAEAFAAGAIVVTQKPVNVVDSQYREGKNVFLYQSPDECLEICLNLISLSEQELQRLQRNSLQYYIDCIKPGSSQLMEMLQKRY